MTGSNLTGACKLVFKVARNEVNDTLFIDSDVPGKIHIKIFEYKKLIETVITISKASRTIVLI